jgi:hypothetical protein
MVSRWTRGRQLHDRWWRARKALRDQPAASAAVSVLMLLSDRDSWRAAKAMIQRYGSNVGIEAAERADEHLENGHPELSATWQRIMTAIEKLQAEKPEPGETVQ